MKLSSVIRAIGQMIFWACLYWLVASFTEQPHALYWYPLGGVLIWIALYFARRYRFLYYPAFPHLLATAAVSSAFVYWRPMSIPILVLTLFLIFLSFMAETFRRDFLDEPIAFGVVVFTFIVIVAYIGDFGNTTLFFIAYAVHLYTMFYGRIQADYEAEIDLLERKSFLDKKQMLAQSALPALIGSLIVAAVSFALCQIGNLPVFVRGMQAFKNWVLRLYRFIRDGIVSDEPEDVTEEYEGGGQAPPATEYSDDVYDVAAVFFGIVFVVMIVGLLIYSIVLKLREKKVNIPRVEEQHVVNKVEKVRVVRVRPVRRPDAGIRRSMRRLYVKRVRKGRGRRNDDLMSRTPSEQREVKLKEGTGFTQNLVDFYEKARYSNDVLTKGDLQNMIKESNRKEGSEGES